VVNHTTAIFRQVNKDNPHTHHDALEFPDGQVALLTDLFEDQEATVLQLAAQPATEGSGTGSARRLICKTAQASLRLGGLFFGEILSCVDLTLDHTCPTSRATVSPFTG
jgi:hypothetical protein